MNVSEKMKNKKRKKTKIPQMSKISRTRLRHSSSTASEIANAVAGYIESDKFTVCGGLIALCCGPRWGNHCIFRTGSKHVLGIINSEHCKWCKRASRVPVRDSEEIGTRAYLRGMFQLTLSDAARISELISDLNRTQTHGDHRSLPFTGTPPYCTVENVRHISNTALRTLSEFDQEFVWGDNLIFSTSVERAQSPE